MTDWHHCAEMLIGAHSIISGSGAIVVATVAVIKAYRVSAPLRTVTQTRIVDRPATIRAVPTKVGSTT